MTFKTLLPALILAGLLLALAAGLRLAEGNGMIDGETARRGVQVAIGLILAAFANRMPKQIRRWRGEQADIREQRALRVGGWSLTLAGLAHAGLWAFAPLTVADTMAMVVVAAATVLTLGFAFWSMALCRSTDAGSAHS
ncbi:hypothetical protein [uncultured Brevundimonas sp.]|uniref:hypothetical protein n=1 Tax=uncultured Brevundimonas sp. TaxID=213418 RepID=UPI0030EE1ABB|tara:strand:- start:35248 stop:35664 length:417 start_codon:yes stop_codon:yes gene_type:complete